MAVKVIGDRSTDYRDPTCLTEFLFLRRIDPVHIAAPTGVGASHAGNYLATAYRPDSVPAHGLAAGRLDDDRLWRIAAGAALAPTAIHRAGIIHCDIKPSNVLSPPTTTCGSSTSASPATSTGRPTTYHGCTAAEAGPHPSNWDRDR